MATQNLRTGTGAPAARTIHATAWTGTHLFVWGGQDQDQLPNPLYNDGGLYNPATDTWELRPNLQQGVGAPTPRRRTHAVWTGTAVIVYGGDFWDGNSNSCADGGSYDPSTDTWEVKSVLNGAFGAPPGRYFATVVSSGDRMLVFGGNYRTVLDSSVGPVLNGGVYNSALDVWEPKPNLAASVAAPWFNSYGGVWCGDRLLVRGGYPGLLGSAQTGLPIFVGGGVYHPESDQWLPTPNLSGGNAAPMVLGQSTAWTGEWYLEFGGGLHQFTSYNTGRKYDPLTDTFLINPALTAGVGAPSVRNSSVRAWTGAHLLVWAGSVPHVNGNSQPYPTDGGLYDPVCDEWIVAPSLQSGIGTPTPRAGHFNVWTGDRLIVWGGQTSTGTSAPVQNTGGVYVPPRVAPTIRSGQVDAALQANTFFRHRVTVYGCPRATVGVMGMPSWMTQKWLDTGCFLEGTPNAAEALQTSTITITADNGIGAFAMQTIVVGPPAPAFIDPIPNLNAEVGPRFEYRIPAGGPPYPTLSAVGMPAWMSIVSGRIEGYPTQANVNQVSTITVTANNGVGTPAQRTFTVTVVTQLPPTSPPVLNLPPNLPTVATEPFSLQVSAAGSPIPSVFAANKPAWMSLTNDILAGTPPVNLSGTTFNLDLIAINGVSPSATMTLAISIAYHPTDVTRDAAIDVVDVQRVVNLILALGVEAYPGEGDANGDSVVDVVDVQAVVNKILAP